MADDDTPAGVDRAALGTWWTEHTPQVDLPLSFSRIEGGMSNLTFDVADQRGRRWVLRRPPLHGVIQSAHDMGREHRIMAALADSAVPVPPVVGHEPDPSVTGAEFYVMDFVEGPVHRGAEQAEAETSPEERGTISRSLIGTLLDLHEVDPDAVGLGDLGKREEWCARQLRRWQRQWEQTGTGPSPEFDDVHVRLSADIPPQQGAGIVHGDYRLDNVICTPDGAVAAVVDWELCTLGDPLADLGILCAYWTEPDDQERSLPQSVTHLPGFMTRAELIERYAQRSGRDLGDIAFYLALAYWRLAAILQGVYSRFSSGAYGDDSAADVEGMPRRIAHLLHMAQVETERSGR